MTFAAALPLSLHRPLPVNPRQPFERLLRFHPHQAHPPPLQLPALLPPPPPSLMIALLLQLLLVRLVLLVQLLRPLVLLCQQVLLLLVLLRLPLLTSSESLQLQLLRTAVTPTIDLWSADEDQAGDHCGGEAGPITPSCHGPLH